jgi:hypothetical protein
MYAEKMACIKRVFFLLASALILGSASAAFAQSSSTASNDNSSSEITMVGDTTVQTTKFEGKTRLDRVVNDKVDMQFKYNDKKTLTGFIQNGVERTFAVLGSDEESFTLKISSATSSKVVRILFSQAGLTRATYQEAIESLGINDSYKIRKKDDTDGGDSWGGGGSCLGLVLGASSCDDSNMFGGFDVFNQLGPRCDRDQTICRDGCDLGAALSGGACAVGAAAIVAIGASTIIGAPASAFIAAAALASCGAGVAMQRNNCQNQCTFERYRCRD